MRRTAIAAASPSDGAMSGGQSILAFWDERAALGDRAGTNDYVLTGIEQSFLLDTVLPRSKQWPYSRDP